MLCDHRSDFGTCGKDTRVSLSLCVCLFRLKEELVGGGDQWRDPCAFEEGEALPPMCAARCFLASVSLFFIIYLFAFVAVFVAPLCFLVVF